MLRTMIQISRAMLLPAFATFCMQSTVVFAQSAPTPSIKADSLDSRRQYIISLGAKITEDDYMNTRTDPKDPAVIAGIGHPKFKSYGILGLTAATGCGPKERGDYMADIGSIYTTEDGPEPVNLFALPALVRYLNMYGQCLTNEQRQHLLAGLSRPQKFMYGGTTNHALMRVSSWYLLAQYFPTMIWTQYDSGKPGNVGKQFTSAQLMDAMRARLTERTDRIFAHGLDEWLSPTYTMVELVPILNLYDFAQDPEVKARADREATLQVSLERLHAFHGFLVAPLNRTNYEQHNVPTPPFNYESPFAQVIQWFYFGEPVITEYDVEANGRNPFFSIMLALSHWKPPAALSQLSNARFTPYTIKTITPTFADWGTTPDGAYYGDSIIQPDFAMGTGNQVFDPSGYNDHKLLFNILLLSDKPYNAIECWQNYWSSNKGEDYWSTDRSSPFQQTVRYDDSSSGSSAVMLFDIPATDPWQYDATNRFFASRNQHANGLQQMFQCRIPRTFDQVVTTNNRVFIRQGSVFVAIATLKGTNEYDTAPDAVKQNHLIMKVREPKSALFFRIDRGGPKLTFAEFQKKIEKQLPLYDAQTSSISYTEASGTKTRVQFNLVKTDRTMKTTSPGAGWWSSRPIVTHNGVVEPDDEATIISAVPIEKNSPKPLLELRNSTLQWNIGGVSSEMHAETRP